MTVASTTNRVVNLGNGATTVFAYAFLIPAATDAVIIYTDLTGTSTTLTSSQYTITGIGNGTGGTVTYPLTGPAIASGTSLTIERLLPLVQSDVISNQTFYSNVIESALDYEMMCIQQLQDEFGRGIVGPVSDPTTVNYTLPAVAQRANQLLSFDANGNVIVGQASNVVVSAAMQPVVQAATIAAADVLLGITAIGTATVPLSPTLGGTGLTTYGPLTGQVNAVSTTYNVVAGDKGKLILAGSGDYTITIPTPVGLAADFAVQIFNTAASQAAPLIAPFGITSFRLYPQQTVTIRSNGGTAWIVSPQAQRYLNETGAAVQIYVDSSLGSDSNSGLASGARALATVQAGVNLAFSFDNNTQTPQINLALGQTYSVGAGVSIVYALTGSAQVLLVGQTGVSNPNVVISCNSGGNCFFLREPATATLQGMQFTTTGNGSVAVSVSQFATCDVEGGFSFGNFPLGGHMAIGGAGAQGSLNVLSNYQINSNAPTHITATANSYVNYGSFGVTIPSPLTFTTFLVANTGAFVNSGGVPMTYSGAGLAGTTGKLYSVTLNANLSLSGATFPGNVGGTTGTGGNAY